MDERLARFRHIAVEGPIAVGKTALARRLAAQLGAGLLLDRADENPFLHRFYSDMPGYAFQVQLAFLFQRVRLLREVAQPGVFGEAVVSDFVFAKDALFARLNLSDDEYRMYAPMYAQFAPQLAPPDLVIWLQAAPATLLGRVRRRAVATEQAIDEAYLQRLCDAYAQALHGYAEAPVLAVDTEQVDPAADEADFARLLDRVAAFRGPREFLPALQPLPLA
jgi:deoxyadenosine/deoxycytidine kinase